jgi:hypothetical protein
MFSTQEYRRGISPGQSVEQYRAAESKADDMMRVAELHRRPAAVKIKEALLGIPELIHSNSSLAVGSDSGAIVHYP